MQKEKGRKQAGGEQREINYKEKGRVVNKTKPDKGVRFALPGNRKNAAGVGEGGVDFGGGGGGGGQAIQILRRFWGPRCGNVREGS